MLLSEYQEKAARTLPDLSFREIDGVKTEVYPREFGDKLNLVHMVLGLGGELGELTECIGTELKIKIDRANLGEELGDLYWYITNYCTIRKVPIPEIDQISIANDMCFDFLLQSVGELIDLVKRYIAYNKEINRAKELETVYNVYAALFLFQNTYDMPGEQIRAKNIAKLKVRYPEKYSDESALNRNTDEERKVL